MFLRFVLSSISGGDQISWFSTTLFVLATGMRPWSHLLARLRQRTHDLHDSIHYPNPESGFVTTRKLEIALKRVDTLERELSDIKARISLTAGVEELYEDLNGGLDEIENLVKKNQRKADAAKVVQEKRLAALEKNIAFLLEERSKSASNGSSPTGGESGLVYAILLVPRTLWKFVTLDYGRDNDNRAMQDKFNGKRKLETILEDPTDDAVDEPPQSPKRKSKAVSPRAIKITISPHSLIGLTVAAVTWPLRICIAMFIVIQRIFS